ncbi:MAG: TonB-dependent receptor [Gemmatimonadota bacterium]
MERDTAKRVLAALALVVLWVTAAPAAPLRVSGRVLDADTGLPVDGANVSVGTSLAVTDSAGAFDLAAPPGDSLSVSHIGYRTARLAVGAGLAIRLVPVALPYAEVVVHGGLTDQALDQVAASVSVLEARQISASQGAHLEALAAAVPNLNWTGGTSRPRYFQIRGIGQESHFAGEGPPNFAVGLVLDDVDLSGLGSAGLLFDLDQVEVFRGPQSTVFGPNSMAGLISLRSTPPAPVGGREVSMATGNDGLLKVAGSVNLPVSQGLALRLGYAANRENGFRTNAYLGRDDTNRRRESVARLKARWETGSGASFTGTAFRADGDNGYDAWSPDNNGELVTYSDRPGQDRQETTGLSLRAVVPLAGSAQLVSISAYSRTRSVYSYDGDWGNDGYWAQPPFGFDAVAEGWRYDFFDRTVRHRNALTQEVRLLDRDAVRAGDEVVLGAYGKALRESDDADGYLFGGDAADLASAFEVRDLALYGQYGAPLAGRLRLSLNLRLDHNRTAYDGATNSGTEQVRFEVGDWLAGGKAALTWQLAPARTAYAAISRGYSAGGVNQHPRLGPASRRFDPEYITNLEVGCRASGDSYTSSLTLFHARRANQQVDLSSQQDPGDPNSFVYYIANASSGTSSGLEWDHAQQLAPAARAFGSLGLLRTHVDEYAYHTGPGESLALGDRAASHAPVYTYRLGGEYGRRRGTFARLELTGMAGYYFSQSHDQRAGAHRLANAQAGYRGGDWTVTLWSRNLLDARYAVQGFYFGLEPPDYPDRLYVTYGDPRQVGVTVTAGL